MQGRNARTTDTIVIGGGIVGMSIAYGLARYGVKATVLDEGDLAFRASRGNFGLVWIQGKGADKPAYTKWSRGSARAWPELAASLKDETGIDVQLRQPGGFHLCLSEAELENRITVLRKIRLGLEEEYPYRILDAGELKDLLPSIGPLVRGASYCPMDGHVNPLKLLRALHAACLLHDVRIVNGARATRISRSQGVFTVHTEISEWNAPKVVLACGLGNRPLAAQVGLNVPVTPLRGQVLIGDRLSPFLSYPTASVRQTDEGTIQIGDSHDDVGFDDSTTTETISSIARRAVQCFPVLHNVRLIRAWGALRVMSPDGFPIYQESPSQPGAYVVTCHSGVTLAASHVLEVAPWIADGCKFTHLDAFSSERFLNAGCHSNYDH